MVNEVNKEELISKVSEALASDIPLTGDYLVTLQENLKALGHFEGDTYPNFGPKTAQAIAGFFDKNKEATLDAAPWVVDGLKGRGLLDQFTEAFIDAPIDDPFGDSRQSDAMIKFIEQGAAALSTAECLSIQISGGCKKQDGGFGPETAEACVEYLKDNPDMIADLSGEAIASILDNGKFAHLKEFVQTNELALAAVQAKIEGLIGVENPSEYAVKSLQGLMALTGHNPAHNIDGELGRITSKALAKFEVDPAPVIGISNGPEFKVAFSVASVASSGPEAQVRSVVNNAIATRTADMISRGVTYGFGSKSGSSIDCSGFVQDVLGRADNDLKSKLGVDTRIGGVCVTHSDGQISALRKEASFETNLRSVKEGTVVGIDTGVKSWDSGRTYGIDHIGVTYKDLKSGEMMFAQSSGSGKGVNTMPYDDWLSKAENRGWKIRAVDAVDYVVEDANLDMHNQHASAQPSLDTPSLN